MGRRSTNPWAKKTAGGMKILGSMAGGAYKVGKAMSKASSQTSSRHISQEQPHEIEWTTVVGLLGGMAILLIFILTFDNAFIGFLLGLPVMVVSGVILSLVLSSLFPKENASSSITTATPSKPTYVLADMAIADRIKDALVSNKDYSDLSELSKSLPFEKKKATFAAGLEKSVSTLVDTGVVPEYTEDALQGVADAMSLSLTNFQSLPSWNTLVKMLVIDDMLQGYTPDRFPLTDVPINLQKNETIIWCFFDVDYYEPRQKTVSYGTSQGFSVRIAKGLYYRVGAFKGEPVVTTEQRLITSGCLFLTNKNLYFYSGDKSIRVPYAKIVAYTPYEDGLGVQKEAASSKPMTFVGLDGWFAYNVVKNISNIE